MKETQNSQQPMNDNDDVNGKARIAAMVAALIIGLISVAVTGHRHVETISFSYQVIFAFLDYAISFASGLLALAAAIRWMATWFRQGRYPSGVACIAGAIAATAWCARELSTVWFQGFSPDPITRSVVVLVGFCIASVLLFPYAGEPNKAKEGKDQPKEKDNAKPSLSSLFGALTLIPLSLLFFNWHFLGYVSEQMKSGQAPADVNSAKTISIPYPARHSDIAKAFVSLCAKDRSSPGGCGFFAGTYDNGKRTIMLVTAAHVAAACFMSGATNDLSVIVNHGGGKPDFNIKLSETGIGWGFRKNGSDIAIMDVTPYFDGLVKNGWDVKYIPMLVVPKDVGDAHAVTGTFILTSDMYEKYNIGVGTPIVAYGNAYELWSLPGASQRQPLGLRSGIIAAKPDLVSVDDSKMSPPIVIECDIFGGYSGGPVFANAQIGAFSYPALLGITCASMTTKSLPENMRENRGPMAGYALVTTANELVSSEKATAAP